MNPQQQSLVNQYRGKLNLPGFPVSANSSNIYINLPNNSQHLKTIEESKDYSYSVQNLNSNQQLPGGDLLGELSRKEKEGLAMGVLPLRLVKQLRMKERVEWQERVVCMEELDSLVMQHMHSNTKAFLTHLNDIVLFTCEILDDSNIQISSKCLNILQTVIQNKSLNIRQSQPGIVKALLAKLNDTKITIKQQASALLRELIKQIRKLDFKVWFALMQSQLQPNNQAEILALVKVIYNTYKTQLVEDPASAQVLVLFISSH